MNLSNPTRFIQVLVALLFVNTGVWLGLQQVSTPGQAGAGVLDMNIIRGGHGQAPAPDYGPDIAVLDRVLAQRVSVEAARLGMDPASVLPASQLRAAALQSGAIQGEQTRALVTAYQQALDGLAQERPGE